MARATLRAGYAALALRLQESMDAGDSLSAGDIRSRLSDCISDCYRGTGKWAYYIDHYGDGETGDVIYSCDGDTFRAPYEISGGGSGESSKCIISTDDAEDVVPRTVYEVEQDEADHLASMESLTRERLYGEIPIYERFISKSTREKASASDFAGKGKSFPILKAEDVMAAASSLGRAGSGNHDPATIKANIIRIAKRKGFPLPKAWSKGDKSKESAEPESPEVDALMARLQEAGARHNASDMAMLQTIHDTASTLGASCKVGESVSASGSGGTSGEHSIKLTESTEFTCDITLSEALGSGRKVKIIGPCIGSSAVYTEEALKQAVADNIFHAGLPMRIDHPTLAEESARPEGSVKDWGAVLASNAVWLDSYVGKDGKDYGKGIYGEYKPFSDHQQTIEEKGPYAGVSIRANGTALTEAGKPVTRSGKPVLKAFTSAEGFDMVTRAGAGGLFLSESARTAEITEEGGMTAEEAKKLIEAAIPAAANAQSEIERLVEAAVAKREAPLRERLVKADAEKAASDLLESVTLPQPSKLKITERALKQIPKTAEGELDTAKFREIVVAEAKEEGRYLAQVTGSGRVYGMGATAVPSIIQPSEDDVKAREAAVRLEESRRVQAIDVFKSIGMPDKAAQAAAKGRQIA